MDIKKTFPHLNQNASAENYNSIKSNRFYGIFVNKNIFFKKIVLSCKKYDFLPVFVCNNDMGIKDLYNDWKIDLLILSLLVFVFRDVEKYQRYQNFKRLSDVIVTGIKSYN